MGEQAQVADPVVVSHTIDVVHGVLPRILSRSHEPCHSVSHVLPPLVGHPSVAIPIDAATWLPCFGLTSVAGGDDCACLFVIDEPPPQHL